MLFAYDSLKVLANGAPFLSANNTCMCVLRALYSVGSNPKLSSQQPDNNNCLHLIQVHWAPGHHDTSLHTAWEWGVGNSLNKTSLPRQVVFISRFVNSRVTLVVLHIFISGRVHSQVTHTVFPRIVWHMLLYLKPTNLSHWPELRDMSQCPRRDFPRFS